MQRRRFYAPSPRGAQAPVPGDQVRLSDDESHHLLRVLRLSRGDAVYVFDGGGGEWSGSFDGVEGKQALVEIREALPDVVESPLHVTLVQALAKGEKFDLVVQKTTELGVTRIVPLMAQHADVKVKDEQAAKRSERWQRIALEAVKQSGRRRLVEIARPAKLDELLAAKTGPEQTMIFFNERGGVGLTEALAGTPATGPVTVFVGPEGGWAEEEIDAFTTRGCRAVTLGPRILRTETAAIVAVALLQHALGDLPR